jgi:hypothetical protein
VIHICDLFVELVVMGRLKKKNVMKLSVFSVEKDSKKSTGEAMDVDCGYEIEASSELDVICKKVKG